MSDQSGHDIINSEKYCPAGKRECERFVHAFTDDLLCEFPTDKNWDSIRDSFEQCPWPSRRQRVEPPNCEPDEVKEKWDGEKWICEGCKWLKYNPTEKIRDCRECVFAAGRSAALREAVEAVRNMPDLLNTTYCDKDQPGMIFKGEAVIAIRALEGAK